MPLLAGWRWVPSRPQVPSRPWHAWASVHAHIWGAHLRPSTHRDDRSAQATQGTDSRASEGSKPQSLGDLTPPARFILDLWRPVKRPTVPGCDHGQVRLKGGPSPFTSACHLCMSQEVAARIGTRRLQPHFSGDECRRTVLGVLAFVLF